MLPIYDDFSSSKQYVCYPKGRAYRSGLLGTRTVVLFSLAILTLLMIAGRNALVLFRATEPHVADSSRQVFKVGGQKYSEFLAGRGALRLATPSEPPAPTAVSQSLLRLESLSELSVSMSEADRSHLFWTERLNTQPAVFILHNFVSVLEAAHMITLAEPKLGKALVVEPGHIAQARGPFELTLRSYLRAAAVQTASKDRTNSAAWIPRGTDELVSEVERRIASVTNTRVEMGEDLQARAYVHSLLSGKCMRL